MSFAPSKACAFLVPPAGKRERERGTETERVGESPVSIGAKGLTEHLVLNFPDAFVDKMEEIILISTLVSINWRNRRSGAMPCLW